MRGVNKVTLLGNVGRDPSVRTVEGRGETIATFPLATTDVWKNRNGEKQESTEWHNIVGWSEIAESVRKSEMKKADCVYLEGHLKTRKFMDKDGHERKETEVIIDSFIILKRYKEKSSTTVIEEPAAETKDA